jgi:hypothetical protein
MVDVRSHTASPPDPRLLEESRILAQVTQEIAVHVVGSDDRPALTYTMLVLYHPAVAR